MDDISHRAVLGRRSTLNSATSRRLVRLTMLPSKDISSSRAASFTRVAGVSGGFPASSLRSRSRRCPVLRTTPSSSAATIVASFSIDTFGLRAASHASTSGTFSACRMSNSHSRSNVSVSISFKSARRSFARRLIGVAESSSL